MSSVQDLYERYQAGQVSRDELLHALAGLRYTTVRAGGMTAGGSPDYPQVGTFEEVDALAKAGLLSEEEALGVFIEHIWSPPPGAADR